MAKISSPIWHLETYCAIRYFSRRSDDAFELIDNDRSKGRLCLRYNDLFLKIVPKRHDRYFSFCNEMKQLARLRGLLWVPQIKGKIERSRYTVFAYQYYDMPNLHTLMKSQQLDIRARNKIAHQLNDLLDVMASHAVVHRDITPMNLLFDKSSGRLILIDFQWARHIDSEIGVSNRQEEKELRHCLSLAGGRYRIPGSPRSGYEHDQYSIGKIISELKANF